jgi:Uncharacterized protein conserved in bacteria
MLSGLADLGHAYLGFLNPTSIGLGLGGALLGIVVGILPGLSATLVIALLTTITIKLPANDAILVLICSYVGALYGGSRTAILLNIPGTAANAASCADGFALAQRGEAGRAIGIATSGAFMGTLFGVICLAAFTPSLAEVALSFGAFEFFWLAALRCRHLRLDRRRRPDQGLAHGRPRAVRGADRPGRDLCLQPLHLRLGRARRRHLADPGAGRCVRPRRGDDVARRSRPRRS